MKKSLVILFAVAMLGGAGWYARSHNSGGIAALATDSNSGQVSADMATSSSPNNSTKGASNTSYKDGTYTGPATDTPYGVVQVAAVVSGGKIIDVKFLRMPNDQQHSIEITNFSQPLLKQATLTAQSANIDFVSGATSTSYGYEESLQAALDQAQQA